MTKRRWTKITLIVLGAGATAGGLYSLNDPDVTSVTSWALVIGGVINTWLGAAGLWDDAKADRDRALDQHSDQTEHEGK